jgi:Flp pilus assembly pilin Flp
LAVVREEHGVSLVECAILAGLIAAVSMAIVLQAGIRANAMSVPKALGLP